MLHYDLCRVDSSDGCRIGGLSTRQPFLFAYVVIYMIRLSNIFSGIFDLLGLLATGAAIIAALWAIFAPFF